MTIDWASDHFVRLYTRETEEDLLLSWEARAVWNELLKKFDKQGNVVARKGARTIAALIRYPVEVVERALPDLLEDGRLVQSDCGFQAPNYEAANYTPRSSAARKAYSRLTTQIGHEPVEDQSRLSTQIGPVPVPEMSVAPSVVDCKSDNTLSREVTASSSRVTPCDKTSIRSDQGRSEHAQVARLRARSGAGRSKIRPDWLPPEQLRDEATALGLDWQVETQEFVAYWIGEGKAKADWEETFRARLVKRGEWLKQRGRNGTNGAHGVTRNVNDL